MATHLKRINTHSRSVSCDGGGGALGHPTVFLQIPPDKDEITCPYCSRQFTFRPKKSAK